jgi:hypothetical protein
MQHNCNASERPQTNSQPREEPCLNDSETTQNQHKVKDRLKDANMVPTNSTFVLAHDETQTTEYSNKLHARIAKLEKQKAELQKQRLDDQRLYERQLALAEQAVGAERDARAFAESVSQRLENELMVQSKHLLRKMGSQQV